MSTFVIKRGDRDPALEATLTDDGAALDLTTATSIRAVGHRAGVLVFDRVVTGDANGVVTMSWQEGDTDEIGYILVEFVVTWPSGREQTFPHDGFERVRVSLDGG